MTGKKREFRILPLTIGLETLGGIATALVPRGTPLPTKRTMQFSPAVDNQARVEVKLTMGESPLAAGNVELGSFLLEKLPSGPRGAISIVVEFSVASSCAITAKAQVANSTVQKSFEPPSDLTDEYIAKTLAEATARSESDKAMLEKRETINAGNALIAEAEQQLSRGADSKLSNAVANLVLAIESEDLKRIREQADALRRLLRVSPTFDFGTIFEGMFGQGPFDARGPTAARRPTVPKRESPRAAISTPTNSVGVPGPTRSPSAVTTEISGGKIGRRAFLSHISEEAGAASVLKNALDRDFLGMLKVFVSSDTESISAGEDWLESIQQAIMQSTMVIVLCSPESVYRPWIQFEAGAAWMRDIPIIPICHRDLKVADLPMPLSLRQGLALNDPKGLERLYRRIADTLSCSLPQRDFAALAKELTSIRSTTSGSSTSSTMLENERQTRSRLEESLRQPRFKWRTLRRIAEEAAVSDEKAADLLRSNPEVRFGKSGSGEVIVGLRSRVG